MGGAASTACIFVGDSGCRGTSYSLLDGSFYPPVLIRPLEGIIYFQFCLSPSISVSHINSQKKIYCPGKFCPKNPDFFNDPDLTSAP